MVRIAPEDVSTTRTLVLPQAFDDSITTITAPLVAMSVGPVSRPGWPSAVSSQPPRLGSPTRVEPAPVIPS